MKADLKTSPCIALADKLQLIDCALDTAQTQAENCRAEREKLQGELDAARQQMETDAKTAAFARQLLLQIRSLKEERERLQSRITLLVGQQRKPGLLRRLRERWRHYRGGPYRSPQEAVMAHLLDEEDF